jgi:hypothetical protein
MIRQALAVLRNFIGGKSKRANPRPVQVAMPPAGGFRQVFGPRKATSTRINWGTYHKTISRRGHTNPPDPRVFEGSGKVLRSIKAFRALMGARAARS